MLTPRTPNGRRGAVLPAIGIMVIVLGIFSVTMPTVAGAMAVRQAEYDQDTVAMGTANAALELGRSLMYYANVLNFRTFLGTTLQLPVTPTDLRTMNGFKIQLKVIDDDDDLLPLVDINLKLVLVAKVWQEDAQGNVIRQVRLGREIAVVKMTDYNFASKNFYGPGGLGPRNWFGRVFMSSPTGSLWNFNYQQTFWGTLDSLQFGAGQANHKFAKGGTIAAPVYYTPQEVTANNLHRQYPNVASMPTLPAPMNIATELTTGGGIFTEATTKGTVLVGNHEIFLAPNGEVWYRPFGGSPGPFNLVSNPNGWKVMRGLLGLGPIVNQDGATILVQGNVVLRGFSTGRTTIASTGTIMLNGNIRNLDFGKNHLALAAKDSIFFENRKVNSSNNMILAPRPIDYNDVSIGGARAGAATPSNTNDSGGFLAPKSPLTINGNKFDFIAQPVFTTGEWNAISSGANTFGLDATTFNSIVKPTIQSYQQAVNSGGIESIPGRMNRKGAVVEASLVAGWYISPAVTYDAGYDTNWRVNTEGGDFTVRGTYSLGIGIDYMATWSISGGRMGYEVHPFQQATAPDFFIPVVEAYPALMYGTWQRLPDE